MQYRSLLSVSITLVGVLFCHQTSALGGAVIEPNYYRLHDTLGGAEIVFDKHLATPILSYRVGTKTMTFNSESITIEPNLLGKLVTVTTHAMPDVRFVTLSFLIPNMKIPADANSLSFSSIAVITNHATPFIGQPLGGVTESYSSPVVLKGVAKAVP